MPTSPRKNRNMLQRADVGIGPYESFFDRPKRTGKPVRSLFHQSMA